MKFVIGFNDKVTDKSHFNPRSSANSPPTLICVSKSSKSKYQHPLLMHQQPQARLLY